MTEKEAPKLSQKEEQLRNFILNGSPLLVTLKLGIPIALFQGLNQLFRIFDSFIASQINATAASTVTYFSQINLIISGIGFGWAAGTSLKISHAYGVGDYKLVKERVSSVLASTLIACFAVILILSPLITPFLHMTNTPQEFIYMGRNFFFIDLIGTLVAILNGVYIAIERARGNSKRILYLNVSATVVKFTLTIVSVSILGQGVTFIALSTLASQLVILAIAIFYMSRKNEVFSFSLKSVSLRRRTLNPLFFFSFPIMVERSAFHAGKVIVNFMLTGYGALAVGALGISNLVCGVTTLPQNGFQESTAAVISQNLGADNIRRTFDAFLSMLIVTLTFSLAFFLPSYFFAYGITGIFAPTDPYFHNILLSIYRYDIWSIFPLAVSTSIVALLYGFGYTKSTLLISFCRIFLFRIPLLWYLQNHTNLGSESAGIVMISSNVLAAILSVCMAVIYIPRISKKYQVPFFQKRI
jgi:Na+-driven multidrug efflux pump